MRKAGILLPIFSLPSKYGIGTLGKSAYEFVDFLKQSEQKYWQILPVGPTSYGDSPYQSFSTFAGNPYFVDLEMLIEDGLLTKTECDAVDFGCDAQYVDYEKIYQSRYLLLQLAFERYMKDSDSEQKRKFAEFIRENEFWLADYALFMAVKKLYKGVAYTEWEDGIRLHKPEAVLKYAKKCAEEIKFHQFVQYEFAMQWNGLKKYANQNGIEIIGDIPIYVAADSADTWANPRLFQLNQSGEPVGVAGCPPDYFSTTGQLWGNPLYNWEFHKATGYEWWISRMSHCYRLFDVVRIDHFRGFDSYYFVPYGNKTAEFGEWKEGPGIELFDAIKKSLGKRKVIAEDLGFLTESVLKLVKKTGYPGMKVLQFAFDPKGDSTYLPHNYPQNSVVYTGTHDNDTSLGCYMTYSKQQKKFARKYLQITRKKDISWAFIRAALASVSAVAMIPMQDYLELGSEARINIPSTLGDNWKWRMSEDWFLRVSADKIRDCCFVYGRCSLN